MKKMSDLRVKIPNEITEEFPDIDWSKIAEKAVKEEYRKRLSIRLLDELLKESELTEEDVEELSEKVKKDIAEHYRG
ncbi:MAG: hypothetical protein ACOC87_03830 [Candidatus Natronoplasma sp.]